MVSTRHTKRASFGGLPADLDAAHKRRRSQAIKSQHQTSEQSDYQSSDHHDDPPHQMPEREDLDQSLDQSMDQSDNQTADNTVDNQANNESDNQSNHQSENQSESEQTNTEDNQADNQTDNQSDNQSTEQTTSQADQSNAESNTQSADESGDELVADANNDEDAEFDFSADNDEVAQTSHAVDDSDSEMEDEFDLDDDDSEQEEEQADDAETVEKVEEQGKRSFGDLLKSVLSREVDSVDPILAQSRKPIEIPVNQTVKEDRELRAKKRARTEIRNKDHHPAGMNEREKKMQKVATRGVVQLFNAVQKHRRALKEQEAATVKARAEVPTTLSTQTKLLTNPSNTESKVSLMPLTKTAAPEPKWNALREDFMMGSKLTDWDRAVDDSDDEQNEQEIEVEAEE